MPFKAYGAFFKPDELDILNDAYDAAWQHVRSEQAARSDSIAGDRSQDGSPNDFSIGRHWGGWQRTTNGDCVTGSFGRGECDRK